jgi:hypothetical protein
MRIGTCHRCHRRNQPINEAWYVVVENCERVRVQGEICQDCFDDPKACVREEKSRHIGVRAGKETLPGESNPSADNAVRTWEG